MFDNGELVSSHADDVLRHLAHNTDEYTGQDEFGYTVTIMQISRGDIAEAVSAVGNPWASEQRNFDFGWYLVKISDNGLVWGWYYGYGPDSGDTARRDYEQVERAYLNWVNDDNLEV